MVDQVLALHRQLYGEDFAVVVQDEDLVPRVLQLLIERRQKRRRGGSQLRRSPRPSRRRAPGR